MTRQDDVVEGTLRAPWPLRQHAATKALEAKLAEYVAANERAVRDAAMVRRELAHHTRLYLEARRLADGLLRENAKLRRLLEEWPANGNGGGDAA